MSQHARTGRPLQNPEWALVGSPFRSQWVPLGGLQGTISKHGFRNGHCFLVWATFWESKNHERLNIQKSFKTPMDRPQSACCLKHVYIRMYFLPEESCRLQENISFSKLFPAPPRIKGLILGGQVCCACLWCSLCVCEACYGVSNCWNAPTPQGAGQSPERSLCESAKCLIF